METAFVFKKSWQYFVHRGPSLGLVLALASQLLASGCSLQLNRVALKAKSGAPVSSLGITVQSPLASASLTPLVYGTVGDEVEVIHFYQDSACLTQSLGSGSKAGFIAAGIPITILTANSSFSLYAVTANSSGTIVSTCQLVSVFKHDSIPPALTIGAPSVSLINLAASVSFPITYTGADTITLAGANVTINGTGGVTCSGKSVTGSGSTSRTLTISGCTGDGSFTVSLAAGTAQDEAANLAPSAGPSATVTVDNTAPTLAISAPSQTLVKSTAGVSYTLTYAGASSVSLSSSDVTLVTTGTANCLMAVGGSGLTTRNIIISTCTGDGTVAISVNAGTASDLALNTAAAAGPSASFTVDNTAPSIAISAPSSGSVIATTGTTTYTVTYTGASSATLSSGDISLNVTGGSSCSVGVTGTGATTRTVTLSNCLVTGGTVGISLASGTASDTLGNFSSSAGPSATINVVPGPATKLLYGVQPSNSTAGQSISPTVVVQVTDAYNNVVTSSSVSVTLAIGVNPGAGTLSGTLTQAAASGLAIFSGISINKSGTGYTLSATSAGLSSVTSNAFNVVAAAATQLAVTATSPTSVFKSICSPAFALQSQDSFGNVSTLGTLINVNLTQNGAGTLNFYTSSNCSGAAVTSVTIPNGSSQVQFYMSDSTVENIILTGSAGGGSGLVDATSGTIKVQRFTSVVTGGYHTCGILSDTSVNCWGYNYWGALGNGTNTSSTNPVPVTGLTGATALTVGYYHSCAILSDTTVKCWGDNSGNYLGNGTNIQSTVPVTVTGITGAVSISAQGNHTCALLSDTSVKCWGNNGYGQLGNGTTTPSSTPVVVGGLTGVISLSVGTMHSCAVLSGGTAKCWGNNTYGSLGNGSYTSSSVLVSVSGVANAAAIGSGGTSTCALISTGGVKCWGSGSYGELGNSTTTWGQTTAVSSVGVSTAVSLVAGSYNYCAILNDGSYKCWGANSIGQLGLGSLGDATTPVNVPAFSGVTGLSLGGTSCGFFSSSIPKCWADVNYGKHGFDTTIVSDLPFMAIGPTSKIYSPDVRTGITSGTVLTLNRPTGTLVNRLLLAAVTANSASITVTPPSGWTLLQNQSVGSVQQNLYYRVATSADVSTFSYSWSFSSAITASGILAVYANVDPGTPIIASGGQATANSSTITAPSLTTTETDYQSVVFYGIGGNNSAITRQSGYFNMATISSSSGTRTSAFQLPKTSAGATGPVLGSVFAADNVGQQVLLKRIP